MKTHPDKQIDHVVHQMPRQLSSQELHFLFRHLAEEAHRQHVEYEKEDGSMRLIHVMPTPRLLTRAQRRYLLKVTFTMKRAFYKIGRLYCERPDVRALLPFSPAEQPWLEEYLPIALKQKGEVVMRWDAVCDFSSDGHLPTLHFVENNAVGIGGIYYIPTTERVVKKAVVPMLRRLMPRTRFALNPDLQELLVRSIRRHAARLGYSRPNVGLVVDCFSRGGPVEFPHLAEFLRARGLPAKVCDARELHLRRGKIYFHDFRVDLLYRDTELSEILDYVKEGYPLKPMRQAFAENRVVSSILGELDHKSLLEIYSSQAYARFFTADERAVFRRHALWTRLLTERCTDDPNGRPVDLPHYARAHKNKLVIKPNRMFGGEGVMLGKNVSHRAWDGEIDRALRRPGHWVIQSLAPLVNKPYLTLRKGKITVEPYHFVLGLAPVAGGLGILGRASKKEVVNVARLGGLAAVLVTS